jgi:DNA polymerase-3 subunit delta
MASRSYIESAKLLKTGPLAPCYYFHGPVDLLKDEALALLLERSLDPSLRDLNYDQRSATQLQADDIEALCNTMPMLAERRVVVIRDVEAWGREAKAKAAMLRYLENPSSDTVLVLVQGSSEDKVDAELEARSLAITFEPLRREHAARWFERRAAERGVSLEADASAHLLSTLGDDLGLLASELDKLAGLSASAPVTLAQVESLIGVRHGESVEDWCRAVLAGQTTRAIAILPHVLDQPGQNGVRLLMQLGTSLVGVAMVRAWYDRGVRGRALEKSAFDAIKRVRMWGINWGATATLWADAAPHWPRERIARALRSARDADAVLKNTNISGETGILTDLILSFSVAERKAA